MEPLAHNGHLYTFAGERAGLPAFESVCGSVPIVLTNNIGTLTPKPINCDTCRGWKPTLFELPPERGGFRRMH